MDDNQDPKQHQVRQAWNFDVFVEVYNEVARQRKGAPYVLEPAESPALLAIVYAQSNTATLKLFAENLFFSEQCVEIAAKYQNDISLEEAYRFIKYLDDL
jgi:hypothetical protein